MTTRLLRYGVATLVAAAVLTFPQPAQSIDDTFTFYERAPRWTPSYLGVEVENNSVVLGEVVYAMRWQHDDSWHGLDEPRHPEGTLEVGLKADFEAKWVECSDGQDPTVSAAGFPAGMLIGFDWTEDRGDWVVWMSNLHFLQADIAANPGDEYVLKVNCFDGVTNSNGNPGWTGKLNLQVQIGRWLVAPDPGTTLKSATLNLVPAEEGAKMRPSGQGDDRRIFTDSLNPWNSDHGFELGLSAWFAPEGSISVVSGTFPSQGDSYLFVTPFTAGEYGKARQFHQVLTGSTKDPTFNAGANTGIQTDAALRCPSWGPALFGMPGTDCSIELNIKAMDGNKAGKQVTIDFDVDADDTWYTAPNDAGFDTNWGNATQFRYTWKSTYPFYLDETWAGSDI